MKRTITPEEAREYRARYEALEAIEREEMRRATPELKLRQLCTLMQWARDFGWSEALREGEEEVRARWLRLRKHYGV